MLHIDSFLLDLRELLVAVLAAENEHCLILVKVIVVFKFQGVGFGDGFEALDAKAHGCEVIGLTDLLHTLLIKPSLGLIADIVNLVLQRILLYHFRVQALYARSPSN